MTHEIGPQWDVFCDPHRWKFYYETEDTIVWICDKCGLKRVMERQDNE